MHHLPRPLYTVAVPLRPSFSSLAPFKFVAVYRRSDGPHPLPIPAVLPHIASANGPPSPPLSFSSPADQAPAIRPVRRRLQWPVQTRNYGARLPAEFERDAPFSSMLVGRLKRAFIPPAVTGRSARGLRRTPTSLQRTAPHILSVLGLIWQTHHLPSLEAAHDRRQQRRVRHYSAVYL